MSCIWSKVHCRTTSRVWNKYDVQKSAPESIAPSPFWSFARVANKGFTKGPTPKHPRGPRTYPPPLDQCLVRGRAIDGDYGITCSSQSPCESDHRINPIQRISVTHHDDGCGLTIFSRRYFFTRNRHPEMNIFRTCIHPLTMQILWPGLLFIMKPGRLSLHASNPPQRSNLHARWASVQPVSSASSPSASVPRQSSMQFLANSGC